MTALTVAGNGPGTAHAIGRALGLRIIDCGQPIPSYAVPTVPLANWQPATWVWNGQDVELPGVAPLSPWHVTTAPQADSTRTLTSGSRSILCSRGKDEWMPTASGFQVTLSSDVEAVDVLDPQSPNMVLEGVQANFVQLLTCNFTLSQDVI